VKKGVKGYGKKCVKSYVKKGVKGYGKKCVKSYGKVLAKICNFRPYYY
jgi:hypothetical protein